MSAYLIAYDIIEAKTRSVMARKLEKMGKRIQKSVFVAEMTPERAKIVEQELHSLLESGDILLIAPLCESCYAKAVIYCKQPAALFVG